MEDNDCGKRNWYKVVREYGMGTVTDVPSMLHLPDRDWQEEWRLCRR